MIMQEVKLDSKDIALLFLLEKDARIPLTHLAKKIGLSKQAVRYKIERLKELGVIERFITQLDITRLGYTNYEVWLQLTTASEEEKKEFIGHLVSHVNTRWVAECGGKWDIAIAVLARNIAHFDRIFNDELMKGNWEKVGHFDNTVVVSLYNYNKQFLEKSSLKRDVVLFGGEKDIVQFDALDLKILEKISQDARIPTIRIAASVEASPLTVKNRLAKLKKNGTITRFKTLINPSKLGREGNEILFSLHNMGPEEEKTLRMYCENNPNTTFFIKSVGRWNYDVALEVNGQEELQRELTNLRNLLRDHIKEYEIVSTPKIHKFDYLPGDLLRTIR